MSLPILRTVFCTFSGSIIFLFLKWGGKRAVLDLNVGIIINLPSDVKCCLFCFTFLVIPHIPFAFLHVIKYYAVFIELFVAI